MGQKMTIDIQTIDEKSPYLDDVKRLWRSNSDQLGFFPDGAFLERARRKEIIIVIKNKTCCGYLLFYKTQKSKVRLTHLCISEQHRGEGLAKRLIKSLRSQTKDYLGIGLYCRRDFPAWLAWPKFGFVALGEKVGRGQDGGELTYFWLSNPLANLLSSLRPTEDEGVDVALDANIFYDLDDPSRNGAEESQGIIADWLRPLIRLCITDELFNEIQRQEDPTRRLERLKAAKTFEALECATELFQSVEAEIRILVGEPKTHRDEADIRQVAHTIASRTAIFVTRDEALLKLSEVFYSKHGLSVVRPSELVGRFEELRNERAYQHERLAGTKIGKSRISRLDYEWTTAFQDLKSGEKKNHFEQRLHTYLSAPEKFKCYVIVDGTQDPAHRSPLALFVLEKVSDHLCRIPLFRLSASVRITRTASTLFRTLLARIIEEACRSDTRIVIFEERLADPGHVESLQDFGFVPLELGWAKLSLRMTASPDRIAQSIRSTLGEAKLSCEGLVKIADLLISESIRSNPLTAWGLEHLLWPAKILECGIPSYIIPIKPAWATDLFDSGLADGMLWGADADLALNPESVYYRSARNSPFRSVGRVLWYVSQGKERSETMRIRACSRLSNVVVGRAKDLYREFRRLGVYEWKDVLKTAKDNPEGRIMALRFDDTERFSNPLKWDDFREILIRHEIRATIQSPVEIPEPALVEIYRRGFAIEE
jgi:predicted nucleic acid-binding protein/GNAT superfamily N-acetyltransferase